MGKGKAKSFKPHGKDKLRKASSKKVRKSPNTDIIRGRVESAKTERKRLKRIEHQLQTIVNTEEDTDALMKDANDKDLSKAQKKKLKRKAENQKIVLVEEEVKSQMDIDATTGTELGAPL